MKTIRNLFYLFILTTNYSIAQTVEKYYDYKWKECKPNEARFYSVVTKTDSGYIKKDFFIHENSLQMTGKYEDIDCKVPNGYFYWFYPNKKIKTHGQYIHDKKDGLWLSFHENQTIKDSTVFENGNMKGASLSWYPNGYTQDSTRIFDDSSSVRIGWFDNGNPSYAGYFNTFKRETGVWKYFHSNGNLSCKIRFDDGKLIKKEYFDENGKLQSDTTDKDRIASYPGGESAWLKHLSKTCYFPVQFEIVNADKAVVVVEFSIDDDGKIGDIMVSTPFYPAFDSIAVNAIKNSKRWNPGIDHNREIKYHYIQAIVFRYKD
jgi:antitoxin component YwqK of YwqJK toxin-antitoxin module